MKVIVDDEVLDLIFNDDNTITEVIDGKDKILDDAEQSDTE